MVECWNDGAASFGQINACGGDRIWCRGNYFSWLDSIEKTRFYWYYVSMSEKDHKKIVLIFVDPEKDDMYGALEHEISKFEEYLKKEGQEVTVINNKAIGVEKVFKEGPQKVVEKIIKKCGYLREK